MRILSAIFLLCFTTFFAPAQSFPKSDPEVDRQRNKQEDDKFLVSKKLPPMETETASNSYQERWLQRSRRRLGAIDPNDEQANRLSPAPEDLSRYKAFLSLSKTGVVKLFPNYDCAKFKDVVPANSPCIDEIPLSYFYSLRQRKYSTQELADLEFKDGKFFTNGKLANGLIVELGNIPIESVTLESDGMQLLTDFPPASNEEEVSSKSVQIENGIKLGNYFYSNSAEAQENITYAIRVIAYRGRNIPQFPTPSYFDTDLDDKRADVIVVFRVVRKDADGNLTIIWKELQRKDSPKIKNK